MSVAPSCLSMFLRKVAPRRQSSVYKEDPEMVLRLINFDNARKKISVRKLYYREKVPDSSFGSEGTQALMSQTQT